MGSNIVGIVYREPDQSTYEAIQVHRDGSMVASFNSGDPIVDWIDLCKWLAEIEACHFMWSSSVDHFFMDGGGYTNLYVDHSNDENVAFTTEQVIDNGIDTDELAEYIINDDIKTFDELKAYYKKHKKKAKKKVAKKKAKKKVAKKKA